MSLKNTFLTVIVPVYNEANRFYEPLPDVVDYLEKTFEKFQLLYVDDGSTDITHEKLLQAQTKYPSLHIIRHESNHGKGCAVRTGFNAAQGDVILFSDADFSTPIEDCERLLPELSHSDIAIGSRGLPESNVEIHQSMLRENMGKTFNLIIRSLLPLDLNDTQCGFKAFRNSAVKTLLPFFSTDGFAFDVEILTIAVARQLRIAEVPVTWRNNPETKVHPVKHSLEMLAEVLRIRYKLAMGYYN